MKRQLSGRNEIGMLADVKNIAEVVGAEVLGFPVEWGVEGESSTDARPDVIIRRAEGNREVIASGEAKRPESSKGLHPMVASEVTDALKKARDPKVASPIAFTTNFVQFALFDPSRDTSNSYLNSVIGNTLQWIPEGITEVPEWWSTLSTAGKEELVRPGLEAFFRSIAAFRAKSRVARATKLDEVYLSLLKSLSDALIDGLLAAFLEAFEGLAIPQQVLLEADERHFDLANAAMRRYFVAQAVAEILTSGLFYQSVRPTFRKLLPLLSGQDPSDAIVLRRTIEKNLADAIRYTGDYETIFKLSQTAIWALGVESSSLIALWKNLFEAINGIRLDDIDSEIIGVIFERLISAERRQEMGQHYTQARLARAMVSWAIQRDDDEVVDLSSGGGTFLVEAHNFLKASGRSHEEILKLVYGNDIDAFAVHLSTVNLATREIYRGRNFPAVSNSDAFRLRPGTEAVHVVPADGTPYTRVYPYEFGAIVGNPPYDEKAPDPALARRALVEVHPDKRPPIPDRLPDGVNLAAWFVLLAAAWLSPTGRIALVLPVSILQNEKHQSLLMWLRKNFDITCWHTETDVWFSDARVAPFVLFAEPRANHDGLGRFTFCEVEGEINGEVADVDGVPIPLGCEVRTRDLSREDTDEDPLILGTIPDVLTELEQQDRVSTLSGITDCTVFRGNKLGHAFFRLRDKDSGSMGATRLVEGYGLQPRLPTKYLIPLLKGAKDITNGEFNTESTDWWILSAPEQVPKNGALAQYISLGERLGVGVKPSVRSRGKNWWNARWKTTHIAINAHPAFQHQLWWSDTAFICTDNMQALDLDRMKVDSQEVIAACLASAYGSLAALYRSNEVGCEGVRWVSTRNLENWSVLNPEMITEPERTAILEAYREYRKLKTAKLYEMPASTKKAWLRLTEVVADAADLPDPKNSAELAVQTAIKTTWRRRQREIRATGGRTRAGAKGKAKLSRTVATATVAHPEFSKLIEVLSGGSRVMTLKSQEILPVLFDEDGEQQRKIENNNLVEVLGEQFTTSPTLASGSAEIARKVVDDTIAKFIELAPDGSTPPGYEGMLDEVRKLVISTIQAETKRMLK